MADCSLSENTAQAGDVIAFTVRNDVEYPAGFAVLQLPEGVTLEHIEQDPALDEQWSCTQEEARMVESGNHFCAGAAWLMSDRQSLSGHEDHGMMGPVKTLA